MEVILWQVEVFHDFINQNSITANYINGNLKIELPKRTRKVNKKITIKGARENNLKKYKFRYSTKLFSFNYWCFWIRQKHTSK